MKNIIYLLLLISLPCIAMDDHDEEKADSPFKLSEYYHTDTKTLDLSNVPLRDSQIKELVPEIIKLCDLVQAEQLIIEHTKLKSIPYEIITYALLSKSLRYVSLKNNKFSLPGIEKDAEKEIIQAMSQLDIKSDSSSSSTTRSRAGSVSDLVSTLWNNLSPELEKILKEENTKSRKQFFKKVIVVDTRIPPITIIDQTKLPKTTNEKCKEFGMKVLYIAIGIAVSLVPTLSTWLSTNDMASCNQDDLNQMAAACNITL
jgi:hypothetical protein